MRIVRTALVLAFVVTACTGDDPNLAPATPDAQAADAAAPPVDAGTDVAADAPATFCATKPNALWCEDFDSITDVSSLVPESSDPSILAKLTQGTYRSPPRALRFNLMAGKPSPQYTVIARSFPTDKVMRLALDWRLSVLEATEGQTLQSFTLKSKGGQASFGRTCGTGTDGVNPICQYIVSTCVFENATSTCATHPITARIAALDDWSHVVLETRFARKGHVRLEQDGATILEVDAATDTGPLTGTDPVSATVGIAVLQGNAGGTDILVDNVVVDTL
jgi:hypothetical protein